MKLITFSMLVMQPPPEKTLKIFSRKRDENFFIKLSSKQKMSPVALLLSSAAYCKQSIFQHATCFALQILYLLSSLPLSEGRAFTVWAPSKQ
jgi:hypothetical protein